MPAAPSSSSRPRRFHVRTGDKVIVISGANRGKTGTIIRILTDDARAIVEGEAIRKDIRHVRPDPNAGVQGGRTERLRPIHISNLALLDPTTGKATRVRRERTADGVARVAKKSGHRFA